MLDASGGLCRQLSAKPLGGETMRYAARIPLGALAIAGLAWVSLLCSYLYASSQFEALVAEGPATRVDLEQLLSYWWSRPIQAQESEHGRDYELRDGEYFRQYLVLGIEPIDVVYTSKDRVVAIYPSFE